MSKSLFALVLCLMLLAPAIVQAQSDPYQGEYMCAANVTSDCGSCPQWVDPSSNFIVQVEPQGGDTYQFCVHDLETDCYTAPIQDDRVHVADSETSYGVTVTRTVDGQYAFGKWTMTEQGSLSGACSCSFSMDATCIKQ